ncbi:SGNH/GDSL hydrolase family protein [Streptomyces sennicomposti]|uniref:SGNH/GDSL hydrolase family protein n=1 Tax=Streptomyces sennicomposti TaxID=2873384 RepID=UPI001CA73106|nr:SGNH/GDSL hydrolase family protein [Streptomyces sennicomposti]MBY8864474.1 SGNH/GDSL hydrolase family protein [Streptomyces sennicomposti]
MLDQPSGCARRIVVSETQFGPVEDPDTVTAMNAELARYNATAHAVADGHGALFLDVWTPFTAAARHLTGEPPPCGPSLAILSCSSRPSDSLPSPASSRNSRTTRSWSATPR